MVGHTMQLASHIPWSCDTAPLNLDPAQCLVLAFDGGSDLRMGHAAGAMVLESPAGACHAGYYINGATNTEAEYVGALLCLVFVACVVLQRELPRQLFDLFV